MSSEGEGASEEQALREMEELDRALGTQLGQGGDLSPAFKEKVTLRAKKSGSRKKGMSLPPPVDIPAPPAVKPPPPPGKPPKPPRGGRRRGGGQTEALSEIDEILAADERKIEEARKKLKAQIAKK